MALKPRTTLPPYTRVICGLLAEMLEAEGDRWVVSIHIEFKYNLLIQFALDFVDEMGEYEETYGLKTKQIYVRDPGWQCKIIIWPLSSIFLYYLAIQLPLL